MRELSGRTSRETSETPTPLTCHPESPAGPSSATAGRWSEKDAQSEESGVVWMQPRVLQRCFEPSERV